jgi:hypothetical protein
MLPSLFPLAAFLFFSPSPALRIFHSPTDTFMRCDRRGHAIPGLELLFFPHRISLFFRKKKDLVKPHTHTHQATTPLPRPPWTEPLSLFFVFRRSSLAKKTWSTSQLSEPNSSLSDSTTNNNNSWTRNIYFLFHSLPSSIFLFVHFLTSNIQQSLFLFLFLFLFSLSLSRKSSVSCCS